MCRWGFNHREICVAYYNCGFIETYYSRNRSLLIHILRTSKGVGGG